MPMIFLASSTASSGVFASLTPPPLPRPPAWTCALTTARPPNSFAIRPASSGESVTRPRGVATPNPRRISLAWYSCIFMAVGESSRGKRRLSMMKLTHIVDVRDERNVAKAGRQEVGAPRGGRQEPVIRPEHRVQRHVREARQEIEDEVDVGRRRMRAGLHALRDHDDTPGFSAARASRSTKPRSGATWKQFTE